MAGYAKKNKVRRRGIHSKNKASKNKASTNYKKPRVGQGK